jgi:acyl carrier protein
MQPDTEPRLRTMVAEHYCCPEADIVSDASFEDDLGGDSLDCIEFAMAVEEEFQIELSDDEPDVYRVGKKCAGRLLDGVEHNGMPGHG